MRRRLIHNLKSSNNVRVIRFENKDVFENIEGVLAEIRRNLT
jgi:very-short-patch-repair endonuclease